MTIQFTDLKIKATPAGEQGLNVSLVENDPTITNPTQQSSAYIDTTTLTAPQKAVVDAFIALMKSKL